MSKLQPNQLLYTDTDSVIVYFNKNNPLHVELPTSDMLGDLNNEYGEMFADHPSWYIHEFMAFGPKMYQLILRDLDSGKVVHWYKTMKSISMKGNMDLLSIKSLLLYRNPVIDFCSILLYASKELYHNLNEVRSMMHVLVHHRNKDDDKFLK